MSGPTGCNVCGGGAGKHDEAAHGDWGDDRCLSWDHPVWMDGSQDHFQCELPDGHGGEHIGDEGSWSW